MYYSSPLFSNVFIYLCRVSILKSCKVISYQPLHKCEQNLGISNRPVGNIFLHNNNNKSGGDDVGFINRMPYILLQLCILRYSTLNGSVGDTF